MTEKQPLVSIIIPSFNRKVELENCLSSIYQQDYPRLEILVVDDGSIDGTDKMITEKFPAVRFLSSLVRYGPPYQRNVGIMSSQGEYLLFLDSDVIIHNSAIISRMVRIFQENKTVGSIGGEIRDEWGTNSAFGWHISPNGYCSPLEIQKHNKALIDCSYIGSCNCMVPKELIMRIGGFDPYYGYGSEDADLGIAIRNLNLQNVAGYSIAVKHLRSANGRYQHETYRYRTTQVRLLLKHFGLKKQIVAMAVDVARVSLFHLSLPAKLQFKLLMNKPIKHENLWGGMMLLMAHLENMHRINNTLRSRSCNFLDPKEMQLFREKKRQEINLVNAYKGRVKQLVKKSFKLLPISVQILSIKKYCALKKNHIRNLPDSLTFFVTQRCNAHCKHCFYWKEINTSSSELSIGEIEKIATSFKSGLGSLSLTGGEPFLRKDLLEIAQIFIGICNTQYISISSNGLLTEQIHETCRRILKQSGLITLDVQISLDGLETIHDDIRRVPHAFNKAIDTIGWLRRLQQSNSKLKTNVALTIQPSNVDQIENYINHMLAFNIPLRFLIVRGNSFGTYGLSKQIVRGFDPQNKESGQITLDLERLEELYSKLDQLNRLSSFKFWSELEQAKMYTTLEILHTRRRILDCYAGNIEGVLYSQGDVALCELTSPVGNLRQMKYDFSKVWHSSRAHWVRTMTRACTCIHDCNLGTALRYHPALYYSSLMEQSLEGRESRWDRNGGVNMALK